MNKMIAICGLDCEKCDAYLATLHNDNALREKTAALWANLNHAPITADMINCTGCRMEGRKTPFCESMCEIRKCAQGKNVDTCGDCPKLAHCQTVDVMLANDPDALARLKNESAK